MNIITYNIIRKMMENPLMVEYDKDVFGGGGSLYIKGDHILSISYIKYAGVYMNHKYQLTDKDIRRILSVVSHCEAMKIRGL